MRGGATPAAPRLCSAGARGGSPVMPGSAPHDIDAGAICQEAREMAAHIEREGLAAAGADRMTVRLVTA